MDLVPALSDLRPLLGAWEGPESLAASPWMAGGEAIGRWRLAAGVAGTALLSDYEQHRAGRRTLVAHGVVAAAPDGAPSPLLSWWFDSIGFPPVPAAEARWIDDGLTITKRSERGVAVTRLRVEDGALFHTIDLQLAGQDAPSRLVTGRYAAVVPEPGKH